MNQPGQTMPEMTSEFIDSISSRYIELYEHIVGEKFEKCDNYDSLSNRIQQNVEDFLLKYIKK